VLPKRFKTIAEHVQYSTTRFAEREAIVDGKSRMSFAEFGGVIRATAKALIATGVQHGDRVAIWAPNSRHWATIALGTHFAGGVVVPINTRFKSAEATHIIRSSAVKMLFCVTDFLGVSYLELLKRTPIAEYVDEIVEIDGDAVPATITFDDFLTRSATVTESELTARYKSLGGDDLCQIMFTSGTTGSAKGAMLTHASVCRSYTSWTKQVGLDNDRYLAVNPFSHTLGLNAGILGCLMTGSTIIVQPAFNAQSVLRLTAEEQITVLTGTPTMFHTILNTNNLDKWNIASLRLAITGGSVVPPKLINDMHTQLGFDKVVTGYGLAEASGIVTTCHHQDDPQIIANSSGRAISDVEVQVVDDEGRKVPTGTPGEVWIRGYNVMKGYLNDPARTAEAIDDNGYLHTGDIGTLDAHGNLKITDRKTDMFIVGGFNAYPAEIEQLMTQHPAVAEAAVVGVFDDRLGEVGYAFVVPTENSKCDAQALIDWCRQNMANYKVPRHVEFVEVLPRTAVGKVLKHRLRQELRSTHRKQSHE